MDTENVIPAGPMAEVPASSAKVPEVGIGFWVVKILTTGLGETTSDFFVRQYEPALIVCLAGIALSGAFLWQWLTPTYSKYRYWLTVTLVAVFGTMVADAIHIVFGVPYAVSTATFGLLLTLLFIAWRASERTLAVYSVLTRKRELFYWTAIVLTFALGTAAGDLTATSFGLGYLMSGLFFLFLFAVPFVGRNMLGWADVGCFWFAYILTRPVGASFADWLGVSQERGGLAVGTGPISLALVVIATALVIGFRFGPATGARQPTDA